MPQHTPGKVPLPRKRLYLLCLPCQPLWAHKAHNASVLGTNFRAITTNTSAYIHVARTMQAFFRAIFLARMFVKKPGRVHWAYITVIVAPGKLCVRNSSRRARYTDGFRRFGSFGRRYSFFSNMRSQSVHLPLRQTKNALHVFFYPPEF